MPDLHDLLERRARNLRPAPMPAAFDRAMRRAERRHRNRRIGAALLALVVFAGAGTGLWIAFQPGSPRQPPAAVPTPGQVATVPLDAPPSDVAVTSDGTAWITLPNALASFDPKTNRVREAWGDVFAASPGELTGIAIEQQGGFASAWLSDSGGTVWTVGIEVPNDLVSVITKLTPDTVDVGGIATGVAISGGRVWVTVQKDAAGELVEIDPSSERVVDRFHLDSPASDIAPFRDSVVVALQDPEGAIATVDPNTGAVRVINRFVEMNPRTGSGVTVVTAAYVATSEDDVWGSWDGVVAPARRNLHPSLPIGTPFPAATTFPDTARIPSAGALSIDGDRSGSWRTRTARVCCMNSTGIPPPRSARRLPWTARQRHSSPPRTPCGWPAQARAAERSRASG